MPKSKLRYVGLDAHKDSIVIAVAEQGRDAAREVGAFPSDWALLEKQLQRLSTGYTLKLCYEAGPTGFELHRRLVEAGYDNQVIAPSLIPRKLGGTYQDGLSGCRETGSVLTRRRPHGSVRSRRRHGSVTRFRAGSRRGDEVRNFREAPAQ